MRINATPWSRTYLIIPVLLGITTVQAQQLWLEEFDGGASTTGFWIDSLTVTDCRWEFAPDSVGPFDFSQDFSGYWPAGPGFDSSFVFLDSDACGGTSVVVDSYLTSAPFDATALGDYVLHYTHQFRARLASFCRIHASPDGIAWTQVENYTSTDVGYPNPAVMDSVDITAAIANSPTAQVRFQFNAGWDWWWALDSISVSFAGPTGLSEAGAARAIRVFPNPAEETIIVQCGPDASELLFTTMLGTVLSRQKMTPSVNVSDLGSGTYLLIVLDRDGHTLGRVPFVKQ